jgi:hypothetical protein
MIERPRSNRSLGRPDGEVSAYGPGHLKWRVLWPYVVRRFRPRSEWRRFGFAWSILLLFTTVCSVLLGRRARNDPSARRPLPQGNCRFDVQVLPTAGRVPALAAAEELQRDSRENRLSQDVVGKAL